MTYEGHQLNINENNNCKKDSCIMREMVTYEGDDNLWGWWIR